MGITISPKFDWSYDLSIFTNLSVNYPVTLSLLLDISTSPTNKYHLSRALIGQKSKQSSTFTFKHSHADVGVLDRFFF